MVDGCASYHPGHNTHWIPVLRKYTDYPRAEAQVVHVEGKQFQVTSMGRTYTYYFHDPVTLIVRNSKNPSGFKHILGTDYITNSVPGGNVWFNLSDEPLEACGIQATTNESEF